MKKPKLLDLFCCAGGAAMGYHQAGFEVIGVDIVDRKRFPFEFVKADAFCLSDAFLGEFDAIHASPPCQGYTTMRHAKGAKGAPRMIAEVRAMLERTGKPWIIENVEGAKSEMRNPTLLCGTMFGLGAQGHELHRHRLFEASFYLPHIECRHSDRPVIGVYGGHARCRSAKHGGRKTRDVWEGGHKSAASEAMGIDWMTLGEMSEAIPPKYTEWIGGHLVAQLERGQ